MSDADPAAAHLKGKKILIVEDETLISMLFEDILTDLSCDVVGPAQSIRQAMDLASTAAIDLAVLDVNVAGEPIWPVAEILANRNIPMIFSSGYGSNSLPDRWRNFPSLPKPFTFNEVVAVIDKVFGY